MSEDYPLYGGIQSGRAENIKSRIAELESNTTEYIAWLEKRVCQMDMQIRNQQDTIDALQKELRQIKKESNCPL